MNTFMTHQLAKCATVLTVLLVCAPARAEHPTNDVPKGAPKISAPALVKSVFVADAAAGKDPFFPNSTRRNAVLDQGGQTNAVPQPSALFNNLTLKGISGARGQMLALINSSTVGVGELAEIRCGLQVVKIRCREIRNRSVVIELDGVGELKELKLREGI